MTNSQAYQALTKSNVHWDRVSQNKIIVWLSIDPQYSAHHDDLDQIKSFLAQAGMIELNRDFDPICGKAFAIFKHE